MKGSNGLMKLVAAGAVMFGLAAGSYGLASAASSSSAGSNAAAAATAPGAQAPWGHQRSDETLLTGTTESKVRAAALAQLPDGSIVRVETDADGNAAYEAHMTKADGSPVTVYVDKSFSVV